jgi:hypothetical protein
MDRTEVLELKIAVIAKHMGECGLLEELEACERVQLPSHFCTRYKPHDGPCNGTHTLACTSRPPDYQAELVQYRCRENLAIEVQNGLRKTIAALQADATVMQDALNAAVLQCHQLQAKLDATAPVAEAFGGNS